VVFGVTCITAVAVCVVDVTRDETSIFIIDIAYLQGTWCPCAEVMT
jgi:hypothetical protein